MLVLTLSLPTGAGSAGGSRSCSKSSGLWFSSPSVCRSRHPSARATVPSPVSYLSVHLHSYTRAVVHAHTITESNLECERSSCSSAVSRAAAFVNSQCKRPSYLEQLLIRKLRRRGRSSAMLLPRSAAAQPHGYLAPTHSADCGETVKPNSRATRSRYMRKHVCVSSTEADAL